MANVNVVYNERQEPLEVLLRTIDRPGDYCMQDRLLAPMPRVDVEGAHSLSFPITEGQAGSLAAAAEPAPYGRGEQTLLDRSVRACGQIDAARVRTLDDLGDWCGPGAVCGRRGLRTTWRGAKTIPVRDGALPGSPLSSNWRTGVRSTAGRQAATYRMLARC